MEAFEQFCAVALQSERYVVASSVKFHVRRRTKKKNRAEYQTHGYEVDLVGARADSLVLATVKSFFGSRGVAAVDVAGGGHNAGLYRLLNDPEIRDGVIAEAAERYGYQQSQVKLRLYVGKFAGKDRTAITKWCKQQNVGSGPIELIELRDVIESVRKVASATTYVNDAVVVSLKVLAAAKVLDLSKPAASPTDRALEDLAASNGEGMP